MSEHMSKKELTWRYALLIFSLAITAFGIAFIKHAGLGLSPIPSLANELSMRFTFLTMGTWMSICNCSLILGEVLMLRKKFQPIQILQVPLTLSFGWFTDLGLKAIAGLDNTDYIDRFLLMAIGLVLLSLGITLSVEAKVLLNAGEGFVKALAETTGKPFANVKIAFDVSCVALSILMSLCFFNFQIRGVREGTLIIGVCSGFLVKGYTALIRKGVAAYKKHHRSAVPAQTIQTKRA